MQHSASSAAADTGGIVFAPPAAPNVDTLPPQPAPEAPRAMEVTTAPYVLPQWSAALARGERIQLNVGAAFHRDYSLPEQLASLQAYGIILRYAPASYFEDFGRRAYFASILDCAGLTRESRDEFTRRDAVERRFQALRAAASQLPAGPFTATGMIMIRDYDFQTGRFPLGSPSFRDSAVKQVDYPGRQYGIDRQRATTVLFQDFVFQRCDAVGQVDGMGVTVRNFNFSVRMRPHYFDTPTYLAMPESEARAFSAELPADRFLTFEADFQPATGGVRRSGMPGQEEFPAPISFEGPFIDLNLIGWRIKLPGGRVLAASSPR